jgi:hypothetical protein
MHLSHLTRNTRDGDFHHPTARILRVYLWAVLHDRPVYGACDRRHWVGIKPPRALPDPSTLSRRLARPETQRMLQTLLERLQPAQHNALVMRIGDARTHTAATGFGIGSHLPPWGRGRRVDNYVTAKIVIRLAKDQLLKQRPVA